MLLALFLLVAQASPARFLDAFSAMPCPDGWAACERDDEPVDGQLLADLRVDWFDLDAGPTFDPFGDGSERGVGQPLPPLREPAAPAVRADVDGPTPSASPTPSSTPVPTASPEPPAPDAETDAVAVVDVPTVVPEEPGVQATCDDLLLLEPAALTGKLDDDAIACLEDAYVTADSRSRRDKVSRMLIIQAHTRHDADWAPLVKRHLLEIDASDPDMAYAYARHLAQGGASDAPAAVHWANVALENRHRWTGATYRRHVLGLYRVRAAASQARWQASEEHHAASPSQASAAAVDRDRTAAKSMAREWLEYARAMDTDVAEALAACESAAGSAGYCGG